jgi:DNA repair exonuclease SbcCD ATPase subunit
LAEQLIEELLPDVQLQDNLESQIREAEEKIIERQRASDDIEKLQQNKKGPNVELGEVQQKLKRRIELETQLEKKLQQQTEVVERQREVTKQQEELQGKKTSTDERFREALLAEQRWQNSKTHYNSVQTEIAIARETLSEMEEQFAVRSAKSTEADDVDRSINMQQTLLADANAEHTHCQEQLEKLGQRLQILHQAETAECPVCKRPLEQHQTSEIEDGI